MNGCFCRYKEIWVRYRLKKCITPHFKINLPEGPICSFSCYRPLASSMDCSRRKVQGHPRARRMEADAAHGILQPVQPGELRCARANRPFDDADGAHHGNAQRERICRLGTFGRLARRADRGALHILRWGRRFRLPGLTRNNGSGQRRRTINGISRFRFVVGRRKP